MSKNAYGVIFTGNSASLDLNSDQNKQSYLPETTLKAEYHRTLESNYKNNRMYKTAKIDRSTLRNYIVGRCNPVNNRVSDKRACDRSQWHCYKYVWTA